MDITKKRNWQIRTAVVAIFLLGFAAGALALNAYKRWDRNGAEASRRNRFEQTLENLHLTADQKTQVHQILGDTRNQLQALRKESQPRMEEIRRQADERLQKVLSAEQWKQFQQTRTESRAHGRRGRGNRP